MSSSNIGHSGKIGACDLRQTSNLARSIHAHLEHGDGLIAAQTQKSKRKTHEVVVVAFGFEDGTAPLETGGADRRCQLLRGGLAGAAGDRHDTRADLATRPTRKIAQSAKSIFDLDEG